MSSRSFVDKKAIRSYWNGAEWRQTFFSHFAVNCKTDSILIVHSLISVIRKKKQIQRRLIIGWMDIFGFSLLFWKQYLSQRKTEKYRHNASVSSNMKFENIYFDVIPLGMIDCYIDIGRLNVLDSCGGQEWIVMSCFSSVYVYLKYLSSLVHHSKKEISVIQ